MNVFARVALRIKRKARARLTRTGVRALHRHHPLKIRIRVTLTRFKRGERAAAARTTIAFKH